MAAKKLSRPEIKFDDSPRAVATQLKRILPDSYSHSLIDGALGVLEGSAVQVRIHLFAMLMRELLTYILHALAPDDSVEKCPWFKQVPKTSGPTREQRARYAAQGGLDDEALGPLGHQIEDTRRELLRCFKKLNELTHLRPLTIVTDAGKVEGHARTILAVCHELFCSMKLCRMKILSTLRREHPGAVEAFVIAQLRNFKRIPRRLLHEQPYIEETSILTIDASHLYLRVEGSVSDDLRFRFDFRSPVGDLAAFELIDRRTARGEFRGG